MVRMMVLKARKIHKNDLEKIREWRMLPEVTKYMYSDPIITKEQQIKWFFDISKEKNSRYWIIEYEGVGIGILSVTSIDTKNRRCEVGHYIANEKFRGRGIGSALEFNIYDYVFDRLNMNKICWHVFSFNQNAINIHKKFGCEIEGERKEHIIKNNVKYDIVEMAILKEKWGKIRNDYNYEKISFED